MVKMVGADTERAVLETVPTGLYVGGEWRAATGGGTLPVEDPATGETLVEVADGQAQDALAALGAAAERPGASGPPLRRASGGDLATGVRGDRASRATSWRC